MGQFQFTVTNRADDKDRWFSKENTADGFIDGLVKRGHLVGPKDGTGIVAGVFRKGSRLEQKNLEIATGVILDIDGKFKKVGDSIPPGARLSDDGKHYLEAIQPDWLVGKLPFRGVAHSSFTNSPQHPKFRVIMPLEEPIAPAEFMRLWFWLYEKTERKIDAACKNPDRMFFLPRSSAEAKELGWPWAREMYGPLLSYSMVPADFQIPQEYRYDIDRPRKKQGAHSAAPSSRYRHTDAFKLLELLVDLPIYHWALENAEEVSRETWRGLATNIAAVVLEDPAAHEAGSKAFHEISEADDARYTFSSTEKAWRDALKSAEHPGPMSYATMKLNGAPDELDDGDCRAPVAHARKILSAQAGAYRPKEQASEVKPKASPAEASPSKISTSPRVEEAPLPPDPVAEGSDGGATITSDLDATHFSQDDFLFDMQRNGWLMKEPNKDTGKYDWNLELVYKDEAINKFLVGLGMPKKSLEDWKSFIKHIRYRKAIYTSPEEIVLQGTVRIFNTYRPCTLTPSPRDPKDWAPVRELFLHLVGGDPKAYDYILDWFAWPLQRIRKWLDPEQHPYKTGTALVFRGDPGAGKGTAMNIISLMYGLHNRVTLGQDDLDGKFHSNLVDKLFVVCNEVMSGSNRSIHTANKLKSWVTDDEIPCEAKYGDAGMVKNNFNIVFTSNDDRPVLIEKGDRRYSVFQSTAVDKKVIQPVIDDMLGAKTMVAAFYDHLLQRDVKIKYGQLYETAARVQVQLHSAPTSERFAEAIYEDGFLSIASGWVDSAPTGQMREALITYQDEFYIYSETLMLVYKHFCSSLGAYPQGKQILFRALRDRFPSCKADVRIRMSGVQKRAWGGLPVDSQNADVIPINVTTSNDQPMAVNGATPLFEGDNPSL